MSSLSISHVNEDSKRAKLFLTLLFSEKQNDSGLIHIMKSSEDVFSPNHKGYEIKIHKDDISFVAGELKKILNPEYMEICSLDINSSVNEDFPSFNLIVQNEKIIDIIEKSLNYKKDESLVRLQTSPIFVSAKIIGVKYPVIAA